MKNRVKGKYGSIYYFGYEDPSLFKEELDLEELDSEETVDESEEAEKAFNTPRLAG